MYRGDGSYRSVNTPVWDNRYQIRDFGLYKGVIRSVIYTDDETNSSGLVGPTEVLYNIVVIGGDRDGQIFNNARLMKTLGGFSNFEEVTLKKLEGVTKVDPSNPIAIGDPPISDMAKWNGDVVYIQFLNGDITMPIIVGLGHHQAAETEATKDEGPRYRRKFNGIYTEITKDGEFTWSKDNGSFLPFSPNSTDPLYPLVSQFAPLPGQEQAVKLTLDNQYNLLLQFLLGLNVSIDGTNDVFKLNTASGASLTLTGLETDSFAFSTVLGTSLKIEGGSSDAITLGTAVGTMLKIDGQNDAITMQSAFGDSLSITAKNGIQASTPTGTSLSMKNGEVTISSGGKAFLTLDKTGFIKLGNQSGDVLKDILLELIKSLSTETAAGFGAPLTNVATYVQLMTKLALITG